MRCCFILWRETLLSLAVLSACWWFSVPDADLDPPSRRRSPCLRGEAGRRLCRRSSAVDGATAAMDAQSETLVVEATVHALRRAEALVDGVGRAYGRAVDSPVEEQHHQHGNVERPQSRVHDVPGEDPETFFILRQLLEFKTSLTIAEEVAHTWLVLDWKITILESRCILNRKK